jgi:hypothetical protein
LKLSSIRRWIIFIRISVCFSKREINPKADREKASKSYKGGIDDKFFHLNQRGKDYEKNE